MLNKRAVNRIWLIAAVMIIGFAIVQGTLHLAAGLVGQYRGKIEQFASEILNHPVAIETISLNWDWFSPVIHIDEVTVLDTDGEQPILHLDQLEIQISLVSSLLRRQFIPGYVVISGAQLQAKQTQPDQLQIKGFSIASGATEDEGAPSLDSSNLIFWLMQQSIIVVRDLTIDFEDDTGKLTRVKELNVSLHQYLNHRYRIQGQFVLDQATPTQIHFHATVRNHPPLSIYWSGDLYVQADQLLLEQWLPEAQGLPEDWQRVYQTLQGQTDIKLWMQLTNNQIDSAQLVFDLHDLIFAQPAPSTRPIHQGVGTLFYERLPQGWLLTGHELDWGQSTPFTFRYQKNDEHYQLQVPYVDLSSLAPWMVSQEYLTLWQQWQPTGELTQLTAQWVAPPHEPITHWQVASQFDALGWQAVDPIPGVTHLRGKVQISPEKVLLQLDSEQTTLTASPWLDEPIQFTQLQADVHWQRLPDEWILSIQNPFITTPWLTLQGEHWRARQPDDFTDPELEMHAQLVRLEATELGRVLPRPLLPKTLYEYLTDLADAGEVSGDLWLRGRLQDYPFSDGAGELLVDVQASDMQLTYFKDWPQAVGLSGQLIFQNNRMIGRVDSGTVVQNAIDGVQVVLDDLGGRDILTIQGQLPVTPAAAMNFVRASPLAEDLAMLDHLEIAGGLELDLLTRIEFLGNEEIDLAVDGHLKFAHNQVSFPQWSVDLTDVSGQVNFNEQGVVDSQLQAEIWKQPLTLALTTEPVRNGYAVLVDIQGQLDTSQLGMAAPWSKLVEGQTDYQAQFKFYSSETEQHQFRWSSDLLGITSHLPAPLGKVSTEHTPVELTAGFVLDQPVDLHFRLADLFSGRVLIEPIDTGVRLSQGAIQFGAQQVALSTQAGWQVTGYLPALSVSDWQAFVSEYVTTEAAPSMMIATELETIDVTIGELEFARQAWHDINIQIRHANPVWRIDLNSEQVAGNIYFTDHYLNGLRMDFSHLSVPMITVSPSEPGDLTPAQLPPIDLTIDALSYNDQHVGRLQLQTEVDQDANRFTVRQLTIRSSLAALTLSGSWHEQGQQSTTQLTGTLTSTQFTQFLKIIKPDAMLESKMAKIEFDFTWSDKPTEFSLAKTEGDLKFRFERGRLTGLERAMEDKIGLGKMLNILSFQSFWRRLALDFDDLTQKGLGFNLLQGRTHLADGILTTKDTSLNGSVVYIAAQGDVNLANETYDLTLRVVPYLTGSLPILATFAVNPLIGAATFVADQLVSLGRRETGGTIYQVTGSWDKPEISTR